MRSGDLMKRFWKMVTTEQTDDGWRVLLDGRPVSTPARRPCFVPVSEMAAEIAEEWAAQEEDVRPLEMPMTRTAATCLDRVSPHLEDVRASLAAYGETDLICYRAERPRELIDRQCEGWDPLLDWASKELGATLKTGHGVMHVAQAPRAIGRLADALQRLNAWQLTAMADLIQISGSLVLALAVERRRLDAGQAWHLSRIDEQWNIEEWGDDEEAASLAARRETDFRHAAKVLGYLSRS